MSDDTIGLLAGLTLVVIIGAFPLVVKWGCDLVERVESRRERRMEEGKRGAMKRNFVTGDRVQMTEETRRVNSGARSTIGIVVRSVPNDHGEIRIQRIGLKTVETWHQSAWEAQEKS